MDYQGAGKLVGFDDCGNTQVIFKFSYVKNSFPGYQKNLELNQENQGIP